MLQWSSCVVNTTWADVAVSLSSSQNHHDVSAKSGLRSNYPLPVAVASPLSAPVLFALLAALATAGSVLRFFDDTPADADAASSSGSRSSSSSLRSAAVSRDPLVPIAAVALLPAKLPLELLMDETPAALRHMAALIASTSRASLPAAFYGNDSTMLIIIILIITIAMTDMRMLFDRMKYKSMLIDLIFVLDA